MAEAVVPGSSELDHQETGSRGAGPEKGREGSGSLRRTGYGLIEGLKHGNLRMCRDMES